LIGALVLRAMRYRTFRDLEELIRYSAPARLLCGLTETDWSPHANTIQDFEQLLGEEGVKLINERVVVGGAGEARRSDGRGRGHDGAGGGDPDPNEMNMMATFVSAIAAVDRGC
jgi:hypothetical protein